MALVILKWKSTSELTITIASFRAIRVLLNSRMDGKRDKGSYCAVKVTLHQKQSWTIFAILYAFAWVLVD